MTNENSGHSFTEGGEYDESYVNSNTQQDQRFDSIIASVYDEIKRQDEKFGANRDNHSLAWLAIVSEEVGEVAKEILESDCTDLFLTENYRAEWVQVAAVAMQAILHYDNYVK